MAVLGLFCCARVSSRCGEWGLLLVAVWALEHVGFSLVTHRCSCPTACAVFLDQGSNSHPLRWQVDS